ncbi:MAG: hypothetical protein IJ760_03645 [Bacteroidales bacterium]|nr:hypothetical protein [Bacteroidales bacterium]
MKSSKAIVMAMALLALGASPALAQRGGGSRSGGGGGSHSSVSSSRSSSGGSFSSGSRSSSSSSSRSSVGSSSSSSSRSSSSVSRNTPSTRSSSSAASTPSTRSSSSFSGSRGSESRPSGTVQRGTTRASHEGVRGREARRTSSASFPGARGAATTTGGAHGQQAGRAPMKAPGGSVHANGLPASDPSVRREFEGNGLARPGRPGGHMPPAARPIHPAPYFHHPWHGYVVHCHPIFWDPIPPRPWYWPGFWRYCNSFWYDYHVTDVVVVRRYVQDTYHVDMVTYGISGDIMYAIVRDGGSTYLQVYDKDDHLLAEQKINKKYCNMVIDSENGGCWISKKKDKDPLLFIWAEGQLLIYEAD